MSYVKNFLFNTGTELKSGLNDTLFIGDYDDADWFFFQEIFSLLKIDHTVFANLTYVIKDTETIVNAAMKTIEYNDHVKSVSHFLKIKESGTEDDPYYYMSIAVTIDFGTKEEYEALEFDRQLS